MNRANHVRKFMHSIEAAFYLLGTILIDMSINTHIHEDQRKKITALAPCNSSFNEDSHSIPNSFKIHSRSNKLLDLEVKKSD